MFPPLPRLAFGYHRAGRAACQVLSFATARSILPHQVERLSALQRAMATLGVRNRRRAPASARSNARATPSGRIGSGRGPPAQPLSAAVMGSARLANSRCVHKAVFCAFVRSNERSVVRAFARSNAPTVARSNAPGPEPKKSTGPDQKQRGTGPASPFERYCNSPRSSGKGACWRAHVEGWGV